MTSFNEETVMYKTKEVPIQFMASPSYRVKVRARAKKAGFRSVKDYLKSLIDADLKAA